MDKPNKEGLKPFPQGLLVTLVLFAIFFGPYIWFKSSPEVLYNLFRDYPYLAIVIFIVVISIRTLEGIDFIREGIREHSNFKDYAVHAAKFLAVTLGILVLALSALWVFIKVTGSPL